MHSGEAEIGGQLSQNGRRDVVNGGSLSFDIQIISPCIKGLFTAFFESANSLAALIK